MRVGLLFGVLSGALWGVVFLFPALLPQFPPMLLSIGRYLLYGVVSVVLAAPWLPSLLGRLERKDAWLLLELALTGNLIYYVFLASAVQWTGVAATSLIIGATPVLITLLGRGDHQAPPMRQLVLPLLLVLAGVACINFDTLNSAHAQVRPLGERLLGMACAIAAMASWSWYAVRNARFLKSQARFDSNQWALLGGIATGLVAGLLWLLLWKLWPESVTPQGHDAPPWLRFWLLNLFLAVACSWLGNALWNAATRRLPLTLGGQMLVFETLFAMFYGFIWAKRLPTMLEYTAIVLLVSGVVAMAHRHAIPARPVPAH
ncbi:MAG TPA: DMT family transporter [Chiayiivirga sp.]|nr:DMT family transporter [Chiayiivirga sp.]